MFTMFVYGVITAVLFFVLRWMVKWIRDYILINGSDSAFGISILILLLALFASCTKEDDIFADICGECVVTFDIPFELDSNGFYHARLNYNSAGAARFNIDTYASVPTTDAYVYTIFKGDIVLDEAMKLEMVQHSRLNHDKNGFTRRIVGPVTTEYIGDTLTVNVDTYWEGNSGYEKSKKILKFIIE